MYISDYIEELNNLGKMQSIVDTKDKVLAGDIERPLKKAAFTMTATPNIIRKACEWGAELLVVHEPIFYTDGEPDYSVSPAAEKKKLLDVSGLTVYRFHDHPHMAEPDLICRGNLKYLDILGEFKHGNSFAVNRYVLDEEMTATELAEIIKKTLDVKLIRIVGSYNSKGKRLGCCFGTPGHIEEELAQNDFVITGEIGELSVGEVARDYAELGFSKALIVLGHIGSEKAGMRLISEIMSEKEETVETRYFDCGDLYDCII